MDSHENENKGLFSPSAVLEHYCIPVGGSGKFLCDTNKSRGLESDEGVSLDIEKALAAATGGSDKPSGESAPKIEPSTHASKITINDLVKSSPELFPLVLGSLLIIASVTFTAFAVCIVYQQWREGRRDSKKATSESSNEAGEREQQVRNSWIFGRRPLSLQDIELGHEQEEDALLSWKDLSCTYSSKEGADITTLSEVTGKINYRELVAIMVSTLFPR